MPRGVRLEPKHDEKTRAKIQTTQIAKRLQAFIFGECELSPAQVTAALGLLKKTIPDLASIEANVDGQVTTYVIGSKPMSADDWEATYSMVPSDGTAESFN